MQRHRITIGACSLAAAAILTGCGAARAGHHRTFPWTRSIITGQLFDSTSLGTRRDAVVSVANGASVHTDRDGRFALAVPRHTNSIEIQSPTRGTIRVSDLDVGRRMHVVVEIRGAQLDTMPVAATGAKPVLNVQDCVAMTLVNGTTVCAFKSPFRTAQPVYVIRSADSTRMVIGGGPAMFPGREQIDHVSVVRGAEAVAAYGPYANGGAIVINLKRP
jgi:hypothetical protein